MTGLVGGAGSAYVSLTLPAPFEINPESIGTDEECKGTKFEPTAPLGKVCVYKISGENNVWAEAVSLEDVELNSEADCTSHGYNWYPAACDHQEYTTKDECTENKGEWKAAGLCLDGDNISDINNEADCGTAGLVWVSGSCADNSYSTQDTCENDGQSSWTAGVCTDLTTTDAAECASPRGRWSEAFCSNPTGSNGYSKNGFTVNTADGKAFSAIWAYTAPEVFIQ